MLSCVDLLINQHSQILSLRTAHVLFSAPPLFLLEILTHVQDLALALVELHVILHRLTSQACPGISRLHPFLTAERVPHQS